MDEVMPSSIIQEQQAFRLLPSLEAQKEQTSSELTSVSTPPDATEPAAMFSYCTSPHPPLPSHRSAHPLSDSATAEPSRACSALQLSLQQHARPDTSVQSSPTSEHRCSPRHSISAATPPPSMLRAILAEVGASMPPPGPGMDANLYWNLVLQDHLRKRLKLHQQLRQQQRQPGKVETMPGPSFEDPQFHHCMSLESAIPMPTNLPGTPMWSSVSSSKDLDAVTIAATAATAQTVTPSVNFESAVAEDTKVTLENSSGEGRMSSSTLGFPLTIGDMDNCVGYHCPSISGFDDANVLSTPSSNVCRHSTQGADVFERDLTALLSSSIHTLGLQGISPSLSHSASSTPSPATSPSSSPSPSITAAVELPSSPPAKLVLSPLLPCPVPHCPRSFTRAFNLNAHLRTQHNLDPQDLGSHKPFSSLVPSSTPTATSSVIHGTPPTSTSAASATSSYSTSGTQQQQQQLKPFPCHLCTRIFSRKHDLQRHIRVHTGSKPYLCMNCQKAFARTDALSRHYKVEDACRRMVIQLEADESARRTQQCQLQQTLQLEVKEWRKAQMLRQLQSQHLPHHEQQQLQPQPQPRPQDSFEQHYYYHQQQQQQLRQSQQLQEDYLGPHSVDAGFQG